MKMFFVLFVLIVLLTGCPNPPIPLAVDIEVTGATKILSGYEVTYEITNNELLPIQEYNVHFEARATLPGQDDYEAHDQGFGPIAPGDTRVDTFLIDTKYEEVRKFRLKGRDIYF